MRHSRLAVALVLLAGCPRNEATASAAAKHSVVSKLASDEEVLFVPTFAVGKAGSWAVPVHAWVFEPEDDGKVRAGLLELVEEALETEFDEATSERVAAKLGPFMVDNERGKTLVVEAGSTLGEVCTSEANGTCSGTLSVTDAKPGMLELSVVLPDDDERRFTGRVHLLEDAGVSVLSDIDDTIKITEVHDKKKLVENTFARPFRATAGVPGLYRRWAEQGAAFHYVSNSPLPLLGTIDAFLGSAGYPLGSIQLKPFRWSDGTFLDLLDAPAKHKFDVIAEHIERFETRRFVLVGDTGERDPEIYAALRRKYGDRVAKIYLRDTGSTDAEALHQRLDTTFSGLPADAWVLFADGTTVLDDLPSP